MSDEECFNIDDIMDSKKSNTVQAQAQIYKQQAAQNKQHQLSKLTASQPADDDDEADESGEEEVEEEYYDEMDYDDELNDNEEKDYRRELIQKRKSERREKERLQREKASEPKFPQRSTRGKRMNALIGKAIEEDENFWNQGIFAEPESASEGDFDSQDESSAQGRDSFDSDFDKGSSHAGSKAGSHDPAQDKEKQDGDFDSDNERDAVEDDRKDKKVKKSVQFNIKNNVERLKKKKQASRQKSQQQAEQDKVSKEGQVGEEQDKSKQDTEIRRSSRLTNRAEETTSILKKRTREEAEEAEEKASNKSGSDKAQQEAKLNKKPRHQKVTVTGGSLANPSFTHVLSEANQTQKVSDWKQLLKKDQLTAMEMMQEAAFTELINKKSLEELQRLENINMNHLIGRRERFAPDELIVKFRQRVTEQGFESQFTFPSQKQYPKNLRTKIITKEEPIPQEANAKNQQKVFHKHSYIQGPNNQIQPVFDGASTSHGPVPLMCPISNEPARYRDPITGQPFANKEAFKILREKYFQKEEEKLFLRMQVLNDMLQQKRDRLRRYQSSDRNLDISKEVRDIVMRNMSTQNQQQRHQETNAAQAQPQKRDTCPEEVAEKAEVKPEVESKLQEESKAQIENKEEKILQPTEPPQQKQQVNGENEKAIIA